MKKNLFSLIIATMIFAISCEKTEVPTTTSPTDINNLISSAGKLQTPDEYAPMQVGDPVITTDGIYQVTTKSFKRAKKINNYASLETSKKSNKSSNDIFLGAVIQGKEWANNGNLVSIGSFPRNSVNITIAGVDVGENSRTVDNPSKETMTQAINSILSSSNVSNIPANYEFIKTEAYSEEQAVLELGFKKDWVVASLGVNFSVINTATQNTVYIYFKQKYFDISTNLPSSPAGFFASNVNLDDLKLKITSDNPAGYISSIDYGRIIVAKMTSSYSANEMKGALDVGFSKIGLGFNISGSTKTILSNSTFELKVLGGNSTTIPTTAEGVYNLLNEDIQISDLHYAVPIAYHVNYLDGINFPTGETVTYQTTEYKVSNATKVTIKKITFKQLPATRPDGTNWDSNIYPDVYYKMSKYNGTSWQDVTTPSTKFNEVTQTMLDNGEIFWDTNFLITDFTTSYSIDPWDYDDFGSDEWMGYVSFSVNSSILTSPGVYPTNVTLLRADTNVGVELVLEWSN